MTDQPKKDQPRPIESSRARIVPGSQLVPDLKAHRSAAEATRFFWLGVSALHPMDALAIGGISFPRFNGEPAVGEDGRTRLVPTRGAIVPLTRAHLERIADDLAHRIIRFHEAPRQDGTRRRGHEVRIPKDLTGRNHARYSHQRWDEPMADYVFLETCADQEHPDRGSHEPAAVSTTGIEMI